MPIQGANATWGCIDTAEAKQHRQAGTTNGKDLDPGSAREPGTGFPQHAPTFDDDADSRPHHQSAAPFPAC